MIRNPVPTSYWDWHEYEEEEPTEWRHFDTSSQLSFIEWLHLEFPCAWNEEYFPTKFDNYLDMHQEPEHIIYFRTYRSTWTVLYIETFFSLIGVYTTM